MAFSFSVADSFFIIPSRSLLGNHPAQKGFLFGSFCAIISWLSQQKGGIMVQISLQNVSRSFGSEVIFSDVTAKIEDHDRIGLVGPNGTGKTTLLRVICGELEPDDGSGEIARGADLSIGYQKQNCGLSFEGTIWQEMQSVFADVYALERRMKELQERMAQENTPALAEEYRRTEDASRGPEASQPLPGGPLQVRAAHDRIPQHLARRSRALSGAPRHAHAEGEPSKLRH